MNTKNCLLLTLLLCLPLAVFAVAPLVYEGKTGLGKGKHIVFIASDHEYRSEETLPALARILAKHHGFKCSVVFGVNAKGEIQPGANNASGIEELAKADLMVIFTRFQNWPEDQMKHFVDYLDRAGPIVGLRTATHGFKIPKDSPYVKYTNGYAGADYKDGFGRQVLGKMGGPLREATTDPARVLTLFPSRASTDFTGGKGYVGPVRWLQCESIKALHLRRRLSPSRACLPILPTTKTLKPVPGTRTGATTLARTARPRAVFSPAPMELPTTSRTTATAASSSMDAFGR